jgi:ATP-binding protein involved in chromosome partitioning
VTSGKGGVGKSTISLNLALALAERDLRVGLLDADVYGPDIPLMVNLKRSAPLERWLLGRAPGGGQMRLEPVERFGIAVMSVGFLLSESQAMTVPAPLIRGVLHQLLRDVAWGPLDVLVVDLPPGTADLQQELLGLVPLAGALIVVGPQDVAHLDAKRVLDLLRRAGIHVLGAVENMTALTCPHCGRPVDVFPHARSERSLWADGVERLAAIPLDPEIARAGDRGRPILAGGAEAAGPQADAFRGLAARLLESLADGE